MVGLVVVPHSESLNPISLGVGRLMSDESQSAEVQPDAIRLVGKVFPPTIVVGSTQVTDVGGPNFRATAKANIISSSTGITEEVDVELTRPPDPTYEDEYRVKVIGGPGEMLEASVHRGDGEQLLHTLRGTGVNSHWAAVDVVSAIAEVLIKDIEGLE